MLVPLYAMPLAAGAVLPRQIQNTEPRVSRNFALGDHFERFIDDQIAEGRYSNASEAVEARLRLLENLQKERESSVEDIRKTIGAGRLSKKLTPADQVFDGVEARIRDKHAPSKELFC